MELKEFLKYKNIVIQCHDNPDADALASGYALMWYFQQNDKKARFIYRGRNEIKKSNLILRLTTPEADRDCGVDSMLLRESDTVFRHCHFLLCHSTHSFLSTQCTHYCTPFS